MDLRLAGEFASDQVDGAAVRDQRLGQAEDINEDGAVELGSGRIFRRSSALRLLGHP